MRISDLKQVTEVINVDEPCWGVMETDFLTEDYKAVHRFRLTYVIRNDRPSPYVQDLTEAKIYSHLLQSPPVQMFALGEHTVGESWDIVEGIAHNRDHVRKRLEELRQKSTSDKAIINTMIERTEMYKQFVDRNPQTVASIERDKA